MTPPKKQVKYQSLKLLAQLTTGLGWLIGIVGSTGGVIVLFDGLFRGNFLLAITVGILMIIISLFISVLIFSLGDILALLIDSVSLLRKIALDKESKLG